jgi:transcription initiation factor IIE alpha subunit
MTNAQRRAAAFRRRVLAAVTTRARTARELARDLGVAEGDVREALDALYDADRAHARRSRRYPTGPLEDVWYAGGET